LKVDGVVYDYVLMTLRFGIEFAPEVVQADGNVRNLAWRICNAKKILVGATTSLRLTRLTYPGPIQHVLKGQKHAYIILASLSPRLCPFTIETIDLRIGKSSRNYPGTWNKPPRSHMRLSSRLSVINVPSLRVAHSLYVLRPMCIARTPIYMRT
jgi:hypothetical protein